MCVVEKAGFEPRTLGTGAERATNCATAPVLANKEMSDENWNTKRDELTAEHLLEQAPVDLRVGWKAWIAERGSVKASAGAAAAVPATGITSVIRPWAGAL